MPKPYCCNGVVDTFSPWLLSRFGEFDFFLSGVDQNQVYDACCSAQIAHRSEINTIRWVTGSIISSTKCLMVQVLFWEIENKTMGGLRALKTLYFDFCKVIYIYKWRGFLQRIIILGTSDTWSMRQSTQPIAHHRTSIKWLWLRISCWVFSVARLLFSWSTCHFVTSMQFLARSKEEGKKDLEQASNYCLEMPFEKSTYNS